MSQNAIKTWLVAYDIRDPKRLRRVHRCLRSAGVGVQYSAFAVEADDDGIRELLEEVRARIDEHADDVRAYHIPVRCEVWKFGRQRMPEGVHVAGIVAATQLLALGAFAQEVRDDEER